MSSTELENSNTLNDAEDYEEPANEPPKKKRRKLAVQNSNNNTNSNNVTNDTEEKQFSDSEIQNTSNNTNNNDNSSNNNSNSNSASHSNNGNNSNKAESNLKSLKPKLKLKTIQKNIANYSIGPSFQIYDSTKMEFKVLFATNQICIRISDLSDSEYRSGMRRAMMGPFNPNMFNPFLNYDSMMQQMVLGAKYMESAHSKQTIERIFIKFDDILYLNAKCVSKDIYIQIETEKIPEIKYQRSCGRSAYTNVNEKDATDLTNGNVKLYAFHQVILTQKNEKVMNKLLDDMKKHPKLKQIIEKSQNYEFDKNKKLVIKNTASKAKSTKNTKNAKAVKSKKNKQSGKYGGNDSESESEWGEWSEEEEEEDDWDMPKKSSKSKRKGNTKSKKKTKQTKSKSKTKTK